MFGEALVMTAANSPYTCILASALLPSFLNVSFWLRGCFMFDSSLWLPVNNCKMLNEIVVVDAILLSVSHLVWMILIHSYPSCFVFYHIIYSLEMTSRNLALSTFVVSGAPWMVSDWWSHIDPKKGAFGLGNLLGCYCGTRYQKKRSTKLMKTTKQQKVGIR